MSNELLQTGNEIQAGELYSPRSMAPSTVTVTARPIEQDLPRVAPPGIKDLIRLIHRGLRGWYAVAIVLGIIMSGGGAYLGWKYTHPIYRSEALIHIAPTMPQLYIANDHSRADFDTFVQSQRSLITSQLVVDRAVQKLREQGLQLPDDAYKFFAANLKVDIKARSEFIQVSVTDRSPNFAWQAATAVVNAYQDSYKDASNKERLVILRDDKNRLAEQRATLSNELEKDVARLHYGTSKLDPFYNRAVENVNKLGATIKELETAMQTAPSAAPQPAQPAADIQVVAPTAPPTLDEIAESDPVMKRFVEQKNAAEEELSLYKSQDLGDALPRVREARRKLDLAQHLIEQNRPAAEARYLANAASGAARSPVTGLIGQTREQLAVSKANLEAMYKREWADMEKIGDERRQLAAKEDRLQLLKDEDEKLGKRIEALDADERLALAYKRIEVLGSGTMPISPDQDRRLQVAAVAGFGGLLTPATLIVLLSFLRRRYHYSDETSSGVGPKHAPLIGILPELAEDNTDAEQMAAAAHSVHQVRVSLMAQARGRSNSYLVTSAIAGEGKTSLTMSLGLSFAASRMKTLIIDADLIGRHLTSALEVRDVEGLFESLKDGRLRERVRKLDTNLFVLSAGKAGTADACSLAPAAMKALLAEASKYFHMIIVDTGPILGSLEATVIAQEVDGVLFAIGRGQQRQLVEKALLRLRSLDANISGCVFNRAKSSDFSQSSYGSSSHYTRSDDRLTLVEHPNANRLTRFGPLVHAVASRMPAMQN